MEAEVLLIAEKLLALKQPDSLSDLESQVRKWHGDVTEESMYKCVFGR